VAGSPELGFKPGLPVHTACLPRGYYCPLCLDPGRSPLPQADDGVSLVPVLRGECRWVRDCLLFEHAPCYSKPQASSRSPWRFKIHLAARGTAPSTCSIECGPQEEHDLARVTAQRALPRAVARRLVKQLRTSAGRFSDGTNLITGRPIRRSRNGPKGKARARSPRPRGNPSGFIRPISRTATTLAARRGFFHSS